MNTPEFELPEQCSFCPFKGHIPVEDGPGLSVCMHDNSIDDDGHAAYIMISDTPEEWCPLRDEQTMEEYHDFLRSQEWGGLVAFFKRAWKSFLFFLFGNQKKLKK